MSSTGNAFRSSVMFRNRLHAFAPHPNIFRQLVAHLRREQTEPTFLIRSRGQNSRNSFK